MEKRRKERAREGKNGTQKEKNIEGWSISYIVSMSHKGCKKLKK